MALLTKDIAELVNEAWDMADELCARELSNNLAYTKYSKLSWEELCNKLILHVVALKRSKPVDIEIGWQGEHYGYYQSIDDAIIDLIYIESLEQEDN